MPMEQFEIKPIFAPIIILILILRKNYKYIIPSNYQILDESLYRTILLILINNLNTNRLFYFPLVYSLFLVIFLSNLIVFIISLTLNHSLSKSICLIKDKPILLITL